MQNCFRVKQECQENLSVWHLALFCSADGIHVNSVLTPKGEGTDGTFCGVVVHGDFPIGQEEPEIFLLVQTVLECLVGTASGGNFWKRFFYPCEINVSFWRDLTLTVIFPVFIFGFIVKPVQVEQLGDQLHTLCGNGPFEFRNTTVFVAAGLSFQRKMIVELSVDDGSDQRSGGNAAPEEIR